jgi:hypothetical protein
MLSAGNQAQYDVFEHNNPHHDSLLANNLKGEGSDKKMQESRSSSMSSSSEETVASHNFSNVSSTTLAGSARALNVAERHAQFKAQHWPHTKDFVPSVPNAFANKDTAPADLKHNLDSESIDLLSDSEAEKIALNGNKTKRDPHKKSSRSCTKNIDFSYKNPYGLNHPSSDRGTGMVRAAVGGPGFWNDRICRDIM